MYSSTTEKILTCHRKRNTIFFSITPSPLVVGNLNEGAVIPYSVCYKLNVISHRVTLNLKLIQGPNRGMRYKPEVCVSLREYGIYCCSLLRALWRQEYPCIISIFSATKLVEKCEDNTGNSWL